MQLSSRISQYIVCSFLFMSLAFSSLGQVKLYGNNHAIKAVKRATDMIYGMKVDSVSSSIAQVRNIMPGHPVVPLLEGVHVLWQHIPILKDDVFDAFKDKMYETIDVASDAYEDDPEGIYFEMAARGLLAEYYADRGLYLKAVNEANKAYALLLEGFDLTEQVPDFLFATGIYNYFREVYPDKYPIYKSFLWLFRSGDKVKGLQQIKRATQEAVLVKVEARIYLAYIYLRYEETPLQAQYHLEKLLEKYPKNLYVQAKYLESLNHPDYYRKLPLDLLEGLIATNKPYYQLAGSTFKGMYYQHVKGEDNDAFNYYMKAIKHGEQLGEIGEYYQGYAYLGAGQILKRSGKTDQANTYFQKALEKSQTEQLTEEVEQEL